MLKGDLLEAEIWGGFGVATVGLRVGGEEAGMRCLRVSPRMVKRSGRREVDVREFTEGQQVGEEAQHLIDFEVLSLVRGTVSTPWADISLLVVLNSITRG